MPRDRSVAIAASLAAERLLRRRGVDSAQHVPGQGGHLHRLGRIASLERENAALLNARLIELARTTTCFSLALAQAGSRPAIPPRTTAIAMLAEVAEEHPVYSRRADELLMCGAAFRKDEGAATMAAPPLTSEARRLPRGCASQRRVDRCPQFARMPHFLPLAGLGWCGRSHDGRTS